MPLLCLVKNYYQLQHHDYTVMSLTKYFYTFGFIIKKGFLGNNRNTFRTECFVLSPYFGGIPETQPDFVSGINKLYATLRNDTHLKNK